MAKLNNLAPLLIVISGAGIAGFMMSLGWSKFLGRGCDREEIAFLAKMWGISPWRS